MTDEQPQLRCEVGMAGLGVMRCNFVLNIADRGFSVAGCDKDSKQVETPVAARGCRRI